MTSELNTNRVDKVNAPGTRSGGPLFDLVIPPVAVIIVSLVMFGILTQVQASSAVLPARDRKQFASFFTPEVQYWESRIIAWSEEWDLDPNMVATVMQIESCGNSKALSGAGAMGLFQVMPLHFSENEDPYKPKVNARRGLAYLKQALNAQGGDPELAFAGYNGGITGAKRPESEWPSETVRFVYWGSGIYEDAVKGKTHSDRLDEWLAAGGASLCKRAAVNIGIDP
jgi:hypothetical protein